MTALLAGIDISTVRIDVALIPLDPRSELRPLFRDQPLRVFGERGDDPETRLLRGLRVSRGIVRGLLADCTVAECALEKPMSSQFSAAGPLNRVLGALTAAIPVATNVVWLTAQDWRRELHATNLNSKPAGHDAVRQYPEAHNAGHLLDEHQLDALGLALAWRSLLDRHGNHDQKGNAA